MNQNESKWIKMNQNESKWIKRQQGFKAETRRRSIKLEFQTWFVMERHEWRRWPAADRWLSCPDIWIHADAIQFKHFKCWETVGSGRSSRPAFDFEFSTRRTVTAGSKINSLVNGDARPSNAMNMNQQCEWHAQLMINVQRPIKF